MYLCIYISIKGWVRLSLSFFPSSLKLMESSILYKHTRPITPPSTSSPSSWSPYPPTHLFVPFLTIAPFFVPFLLLIALGLLGRRYHFSGRPPLSSLPPIRIFISFRWSILLSDCLLFPSDGLRGVSIGARASRGKDRSVCSDPM